MLNGRVYGSKRLNAQNTNLFASAKDEEPEFVEWGYGGMGSVKTAGHGDKQWSKLQSGGTLAGTGGDDDDDGGGLSWARKRKEAREKAKKEAEEKAKAEAEAKENGETEQTESTEVSGQGVAPTEEVAAPASETVGVQEEPAPAVSPIPTENTAAKEEEAPVSPPAASPESPSPPADEAALSPPSGIPQSQPHLDSHHDDKEKDEQHITTAVNVPAPIRREHSHHRTNSAHGSAINSHTNLADIDRQRERAMSPLRLPSFEAERQSDTKPVEEEESGSRSGSSSDSDEDREASEDEDDDDAEDEDEEEAEVCPTFIQSNSIHVISVSTPPIIIALSIRKHA